MPENGNPPLDPPAAALSDAQFAAIGASAQRKVSLRLLPILGVGYGLAYMDRINISFASLQMNRDLHFSATVYGVGAGLFFIGYALCEVPSNLLMLRYGARRWLARIMFTWGLLAAAMMFVRTPLEFYLVRFLLGVAEAGFFPGVLYYLTLWFPAPMRARAVSRFYIALPLSSTVMGSLAGALLGLGGRFGLAGWQWLFLLEGLPSILFSLVILRLLPSRPASVAWLTDDEKSWLQRQLDADATRAHLGHQAGVLQALLSPQVWLIGAFFFCALTCNYAYSFSAPAILQNATGWSVAQVGYLVAGFGLAGAAAMLLNAIHSDRTRERRWHSVMPCIVMAASYLAASLSGPGWLTVAALAVSFTAFMALQGPALSVPTEFLAGRAAAAGIAAMNTITMFSGFVGPVWMGWMKDLTGTYQSGLRGLLVPILLAAGVMWILTRSLQRIRISHGPHLRDYALTGPAFDDFETRRDADPGREISL
ncbi:MAG TPA: MFS transporter [Terracidiphilus sp.]|jgi:ACS family tartrate transporter-like MFS transporter